MSLVPDYDDSSEETEEEEEDTPSPAETKAPPTKLPTPGFLSGDERRIVDDDETPKTSVFANPFVAAENAKKAILEKHVKMVDTTDNTATINGKRVCWNYRKGRCRFGHNCKYAHDSDLQKTKEQLDVENRVQQVVVCQSDEQPSSTTEQAAKQKRKRPGLTQGLVPGKKVMKSYMSQQKSYKA